MGRGRKGLIISSNKQNRATSPAHFGRLQGHSHIEKRIILSPQDVEAAKRLTKEQLAYILFRENERPLTKISEATECLVAQPSTPHERSPAWAHQTDNT